MADPTFRISCSTATLYEFPLALALAIIKDAGFAGVEFVVSPETLVRGMRATARTLARSGLAVYSVHPPLYRFPGWPRDQATGMDTVVTDAEQLGAEVAVIHAPRSRTMQSPRAQRYVAGIAAAQAKAGTAGIAIGLETTQKPYDKAPLLFDDLDYLLRFADDHHLAVTLDTCHAGANGDDLVATGEQIGQRLRNIHFSDVRVTDPEHKPQTHLMPGTGNRVDLAAFVNSLAASHYSGLVTAEVSPKLLLAWPPRRIAARLAEVREFVRRAAAPTATPLHE